MLLFKYVKPFCVTIVMLLCLMKANAQQQLFLDIIDTTTRMRYQVNEGDCYRIKLITDSIPVKRVVKKIYTASMVVSTDKKAGNIEDSVNFQLIDSIGFQPQKAFWKTYGIFAGLGAAIIAGSYYTLSDNSTDTKQLFTVLSIPIGLIVIPFTGAYFLTDYMYPFDYVNTSGKYYWFVKKVTPKAEKKKQ